MRATCAADTVVWHTVLDLNDNAITAADVAGLRKTLFDQNNLPGKFLMEPEDRK